MIGHTVENLRCPVCDGLTVEVLFYEPFDALHVECIDEVEDGWFCTYMGSVPVPDGGVRDALRRQAAALGTTVQRVTGLKGAL